MSRLDSRVGRLEREAGVDQPSCCYETLWQFDGGVVRSDRATPFCPHGRPWIRGKTIIWGGPPCDPNEIL